jgi:uncharacterized membrane protein YhiD involved in acid resistance
MTGRHRRGVPARVARRTIRVDAHRPHAARPLRLSGIGRAIQGIVGGIGFLGAGVILHQGPESRIRNLSTAATIWISAALGIACGLGAWRTGGVAAVLALIVLTLGARIDHALFGRFGMGRSGPDNSE